MKVTPRKKNDNHSLSFQNSAISSYYINHNFSNSNSSTIESSLLDSGANDHVCSSHSLFNTYYCRITPIEVTLPYGNYVTTQFTSTIHLTPTITLINVLFLPYFSLNLISISKLCIHSNCIVPFSAS